MLLRHPDHFPRAAAIMAGAFDTGLIFYWSIPTAPPWYAAEIERIAARQADHGRDGERFWSRLWKPLYDSLEGNPFAAMPSLHFGISVVAARLLSDVGRGPGTLGWAYALTLGFGLVYLGEHYVIDLIAGLALAEGTRRAAPYAARPLLAAARQVQRLEPGAVMSTDRRRTREGTAPEPEPRPISTSKATRRRAAGGPRGGHAGIRPARRQAAPGRHRPRLHPGHRRDLLHRSQAPRARRGDRPYRRSRLVLDRDRSDLQRGRVRRLRSAVPRHSRRSRLQRGTRAARRQGLVPDHDGGSRGHENLLSGGRRRDRAHLLGVAQGGDAAAALGVPDGGLPRAHLLRVPGCAGDLWRAASDRCSARRRTGGRHDRARGVRPAR